MPEPECLVLKITAWMDIVPCDNLYLHSMNISTLIPYNDLKKTVSCTFTIQDFSRNLVYFEPTDSIEFRGFSSTQFIPHGEEFLDPENVTIVNWDHGGTTKMSTRLMEKLWRINRAAKKIQHAWMKRRFRREKRVFVMIDDLIFDGHMIPVLPFDIIQKILRIRLKLRIQDRYNKSRIE
ncbi:hypothetical protein TetV_148 [Tetraselmis virus 1]|uniref:Uncharacterized protein n=1 Tax=Tetraselmis virus 1 TaxID=2060617 RepID=A0A2P0VMX8_9VIRU|nr:hypothetical protein QJ968_gp148 [Tetraselmis virus 1]AUF82240.1 hypothetical protein TetV_148 [Tetraselmis virus 1]